MLLIGVVLGPVRRWWTLPMGGSKNWNPKKMWWLKFVLVQKTLVEAGANCLSLRRKLFSNVDGVMSVWLPIKVSFISQQVTPSTVKLLRVSWILFETVSESILLKAVIWRPSLFPEKSLCSGSRTTLSTPRPPDALTDFIASATLGNTELPFSVKAASCTPDSTVVNTLSTSQRNLLAMLFSSVCTSIWELSVGLSCLY